MKISGAIFRAVWVQERHIADEKQLAALLVECGLKSERHEQSFSQAVQERYESNTAQAIAAGVFGAPSYVVDGELFWGQDRLDFVERRKAHRAARSSSCRKSSASTRTFAAWPTASQSRATSPWRRPPLNAFSQAWSWAMPSPT